MRLFCTIELPEEMREKLHLAASELPGAHFKKVEKESLHITLCFFAEAPQAHLQQLQSALEWVEFLHLGISIKGIGVFPSLHNPAVLFANARCAPLEGLVCCINAKVQASGVEVQGEKRKFHAHVTLARPKANAEKAKAEIASFAKKYSQFDFGSFVAQEFALKKSVLQPSGPKYETLSTYHAQAFHLGFR